MGIFGRLFGKAPAKSAAADDDLLDGVDDEDAGTVAVTALSVESSPKQVCRSAASKPRRPTPTSSSFA